MNTVNILKRIIIDHFIKHDIMRCIWSMHVVFVQPCMCIRPTVSVYISNRVCVYVQPCLCICATVSVYMSNRACVCVQPWMFICPTVSVYVSNGVCVYVQPWLCVFLTVSAYMSNRVRVYSLIFVHVNLWIAYAKLTLFHAPIQVKTYFR